MNRVAVISTLMSVSVLVLSAGARAELVVDRQPHPIASPTSETGGFFSDFVGGAGISPRQRLSSAFTLPDGKTTITGINWWGNPYQARSLVDDFTVRIFGDGGGTQDSPPSTPLYEAAVKYAAVPYAEKFTSANATTTFKDGTATRTEVELVTPLVPPTTYYEMSFTSPITLASNTKYYVSIVNRTLNENALWAWVESETGKNGFYRHDDTEAWEPGFGYDEGDVALQIEAVPVPGAALLGSMGLGVAGWIMKRRKKGAQEG